MANEFVIKNGYFSQGSSNITGSLNVSAGVTASLFGTASWAQNAVTASFITTAQTASYVLQAVSASQATSASYAITASHATSLGILNQNVVVTGSLTVTNDLIVQGSASVQYITSSQLNINDNIITVNTITPSVRFGGLAVIDSGSSPIQSGSMLFDSQNNQWIFVHQSAPAAAITSSVLIMGPQTFNSIGSETGLTTNRIPKAVGADLGEHITDSNITDSGTLVTVNSNTTITGSLNVTAGITGSLQGTASYAPNFANTDLTFTGNRIHLVNPTNLTDNILWIIGSGSSTAAAGGKIYLGNDRLEIGLASPANYISALSQSLTLLTSGQPAITLTDSEIAFNSGSSLTRTFRVQGNSTLTGSLNVSAGITGSLFGTASWANNATTAITSNTSSYVNPLQQTVIVSGSTQITGSLGVTGSLIITGSTSTDLVRITQNGTGNAFVVEDSANPDSTSFTISNEGNVGIGIAPSNLYKLYAYSTGSTIYSISPATAIVGSGGNYGVQGLGTFVGVLGAGSSDTGTIVGIYGTAGDVDFGTGEYIAGKFIAASANGTQYAVQLQDGTQGIGKVLVAQSTDGKANWGTRLSGSYEITGSLAISGSVIAQSGNSATSDVLLQATLLYLSNNF